MELGRGEDGWVRRLRGRGGETESEFQLAPNPLVWQAHKVGVISEGPFLMRCERLALKFTAEVVAIDAGMACFVAEFNLVRGDAWLFKELCNRILPHIAVGKTDDITR